MSAAGRDVVAAEVHRKAIDNLTNEMGIALLRTSGSPIVTEAMDFSTCLMDTEPEHLGFAARVLFHFGTSLVGTSLVAALAKQEGDLRPGDGWIINDPHEGGAAHQGDVAVVMPMFHDGEHLGWGFVNMHLLDMGGGGLSGIAPGAHDVYAEALRFPPLRIIRDGAVEPAWEQFLVANVRTPGPVLNDLRSMIAANNVGARKLGEIVERFGIERHREFARVNQRLTEQVLRERIGKIPDGVYESVEWVEWDGHDAGDQLLEMRLAMEVEGTDMRLRFSGAPQIDGFVNAGKGAIWGTAVTPILTTLAYGDLPVNGGLWRPLEIDLGEPGTIVNPELPAPVSDGHAEVGARASKLVKDALSQALSLSDDEVLRSRVGGKAHDGSPVSSLFGTDQHGRQSVVLYLDSSVGGGGGATAAGDGQDSYGLTSMTGCGLTELETHEAADPVSFLWRKVMPNSGGPGQMRGGQALDQAFAMVFVDSMDGPAWTSCAEVPASGFGGGLPGCGSSYYVIRESNAPALLERGLAPLPERLEGHRETLNNKVGHMTMNRGDVLVMISGGGGGLGDPLLREPELVARDVAAGWITVGHAEAAYGVRLEAAGGADAAASSALREQLRRERIGADPEAELRAPRSVGVAVVLDGGGWACGSCAAELAARDGNWREGAKLVETPIAERFERLEMLVRARREDPPVVLREHFCPRCAAGLGADVAIADTPRLAGPRLAAAPIAAGSRAPR